MNDPWFRMHANIGDKPVSWRCASVLGIPLAKAVGHLAMFWGKVSQHVPGGDVSEIGDSQLEGWAGWDGKRGAFAAWLRADHLSEGVVNEYEEYSGTLDLRREKDRQRKAEQRERERTSQAETRTVPQEVTRKSRGSHADIPQEVTRMSRRTIRNDTKQTTKATTCADGADADASPEVVAVEKLPDSVTWPKSWAFDTQQALAVAEASTPHINDQRPTTNDQRPGGGRLAPRTLTEEEADVLGYYRQRHPLRRVDEAKARKYIGAALKTFSAEDLKAAIDGNARDAWHVEHKKHEMSYVFRDADRISTFLELETDRHALIGANGNEAEIAAWLAANPPPRSAAGGSR